MAAALRVTLVLTCFWGTLGSDGTDHCVCTGPCPKYGKWVCHFANGSIDEKYKYGDEADCMADCKSDSQLTIPGPHDLVCDLFNNTKMMNRLENVVCKKVPAGWGAKTACNMTVSHIWKHEASEQKCPGFPTPWEPLKPYEHAAWCWAVRHVKDDEQEVVDHLCKNQTRLKRMACDEAVKLAWERLLHNCNITTQHQNVFVV